ncbi:MAG: hypothetical protein JW786_07775 [Desulfobacterales bacterium]|nr:hypothetical protein [Desulfobacterales bacterium]
MKKWVLMGAGAVVVIIIIVLVLGISNLGPIIKNGVNTYGPQMTKTELRLKDVDISIFSGQATLKDFYMGNPKGFKSSQAVSVKSLYVDMDEKSLLGDPVIINKIEVVGPEITYEKIRGTDNFQTILNNIKKSSGATEPSKKETAVKQGGGKKLLIQNFIVREGKVNLAVSMVGGKTISAPLPDIHLKDVGKEKGGATPSEAFEKIFSSLYKQITSPAVSDLMNKELKALGSSLEALGGNTLKQVENLGSGAQKGTETVTDKVKGLFKK